MGISSSGPHSNGFSLIRKLVEVSGVSYSDKCAFDASKSWGEVLIEPTRIYVNPVLEALRGGLINGLAHITGGGFVENVPRCMPDDCRAEIDASAWVLPPVFQWLREVGNLPGPELARTFNCGVGMIAIVSPENVEGAKEALGSAGDEVFEIGVISAQDGPAQAVMTASPGAWGYDDGWTAVTGAHDS